MWLCESVIYDILPVYSYEILHQSKQCFIQYQKLEPDYGTEFCSMCHGHKLWTMWHILECKY